MYRLFFAPGTCATASHISLAEASADYELAKVDFANSAQRQPEYLAVNPKGRVPALITSRGVLTETPAILLYIAQSHPKARLAPLDDPFVLARAQEFNSYLCSTVHIAHAHRMRGHRWADDPAVIEAMKLKVPQNIAECFELIEKQMFAGPWVLGNDYSICDAYLYTVGLWLEGDGIDPGRFPKVLDHRMRMNQRPAVQRAIAEQRAA